VRVTFGRDIADFEIPEKSILCIRLALMNMFGFSDPMAMRIQYIDDEVSGRTSTCDMGLFLAWGQLL
jgi:hypothetical protein